MASLGAFGSGAGRRRVRIGLSVLAGTVAGAASIAALVMGGRSGPAVHRSLRATSELGPYYGSAGGRPLNRPIVGVTATTSGRGYWLVASDGGIFSFGDAAFRGSTGGIRLNQPIVGMAATPHGGGYWLVASDGGIFSFGDAAFYGSTGSIRLNQPIVGMAASPDGGGYWMVASDGGIFSFGDAAFHGSAAGSGGPVAGMASTSTGAGYWVTHADGTVANFGDAPAWGPAAGTANGAPVAGIAAAPGGYWLAGIDASVSAHGHAAFYGSMSGAHLKAPVVGIAGARSGNAYWMASADGGVFAASKDQPLRAPVNGAYSFIALGPNGRPVRFNPCAPIHYATNLSQAPPTVAGDITTALNEITAATGMQFVNDGPTSEVPTSHRPAEDAARYGHRWSPLVIAWLAPTQTDLLPAGAAGVGGPQWVDDTAGQGVTVTAEVVVDAPAAAGLAPGYGSGATVGKLLLHELGHTIGLGHTGDPTQIMYPTLSQSALSAYGSGDLTGLSNLGTAQGCLTTPPAP